MQLDKWFSVSLLLLTGAVATAMAGAPAASDGGKDATPAPGTIKDDEEPPMTLTIAAFADGAAIPAHYTQAGAGTSPPLGWANAPAGTKSFMLHVHDMDTASVTPYRSVPTRLHWLVWNIPATAKGISEAVASGSPLPDGSLQISDGGPGYFPPGAGLSMATRPGPIVHRYRFEIYALDAKLEVQPEADAVITRGKIIVAMNGHILARAVYTGLHPSP